MSLAHFDIDMRSISGFQLINFLSGKSQPGSFSQELRQCVGFPGFGFLTFAHDRCGLM